MIVNKFYVIKPPTLLGGGLKLKAGDDLLSHG